MFKLVVFDLDGTLLDTAPDLYLALSDTLKDYGKEPPPFEEFKKHIGGGAYGFIAPFLPPELWDEALRKLRYYYLTRYINVNTRPFGGVEETLKALKENGITLAVATNKITEGAKRVLNLTGLDRYFSLVVGRDLPKGHKPSKEHLLYITERVGVKPERTLMVGDRSDDLLCAIGAGAAAGLALWGYTEENLDVQPHFRFERPTDVLKLF
jgi:phosphoglycolate phosphatase